MQPMLKGARRADETGAPMWRDIWIQLRTLSEGLRDCNWCLQYHRADYLVGRTSRMTGKAYADPACRQCATRWALAAGFPAVEAAVETHATQELGGE
jgi:hypothetical protein